MYTEHLSKSKYFLKPYAILPGVCLSYIETVDFPSGTRINVARYYFVYKSSDGYIQYHNFTGNPWG
jgi:hypothetical protein